MRLFPTTTINRLFIGIKLYCYEYREVISSYLQQVLFKLITRNSYFVPGTVIEIIVLLYSCSGADRSGSERSFFVTHFSNTLDDA